MKKLCRRNRVFKHLAAAICLIMCLGLLPVNAMADEGALNPKNYQTNITKISIGAPITGLDGKKYTPVDVHFTAEQDPGEDGASMLEGVIKAVHDGAESYVAGVGMTLMGVTGTPGNNQFQWDPNTKQGIAKFNVPVLDAGEAQTVEKSMATGLVEVNGLKDGDTAKISLESWVYGDQDCPVLVSNEAVYEYKRDSLPIAYDIIAYDSTEYWEWRFNTAQHWEVCTEGDPVGQTRNQGPHTYNNSAEAADFSVSLEGFDETKPLSPDNSPVLTDSDGAAHVFDGCGFKSLNAGAGADASDPAPAPVYLSSFANLKSGAAVKATPCDTCCYVKVEGGAAGQVDGAAVSIDKMTAEAGQEVKITIVPEEGREIENVQAESGGQPVEVRQTPANRGLRSAAGEEINYYYTQPEGSVTITVTMKAPCQHANAVPAFNWEGHWMYCPDCGRGVEGTFEEHFPTWTSYKNEGIQTVRVTVPGMEQTEQIPAGVAMGVGNTVSFIGKNKTFTYLPDNSGRISAMDDATESLYIPGGFTASPGDPGPEVPDHYSVMIPGAEMEMMVEYEDCGYGMLNILIGHGNRGKIWADKWFAAAGETVNFGTSDLGGYKSHIVVKSGDTVIPYTQGEWQNTFTMSAGNVTLEVTYEQLPTLMLPAVTTTIEESAFEGCGAYFIVVPEGCEHIGAYAFKDCPNLEALYITGSETTIDDTALEGCTDVCVYGHEESKAHDFASKNYGGCYFWAIEELGE